MTNLEFIAALAKRTSLSQRQTSDILESTVSIVTEILEKGDSIAIQGFGTFETKKKNERISTNPRTKQRFLIPPKIAVSFRPGHTLKENLKKI